MQFSDLRLSEPILRAVAAEGYTVATPIQAKAIPPALQGRDVMGAAQTGTGKTAAFALPILHRLSTTPPTQAAAAGRVRTLILCPTRELALQIADSFRVYGRHLHLTCAVVFGGVGQNPQAQALRRGVDVVVATPGRLLDLINQNLADLRGVEVLVLDEADRMLDMGFINDIRKIVARLPKARQTMMFSATMPPEIRTLANSLLRDPQSVQVAPVASTADGIEESVYFVEKRNKPVLLAHLVGHLPMYRTIVFTRTKHGADRVVRHLHSRGIRAEAIHGNKSQNARERALGNFRANKTPILVATDIASRGIDVDGITHVVNYDLTHEPEAYVHRIGRTARAGATGAAVSFCDREEVPNLRAIEKLIRRPIPVRNDHPAYSAAEAAKGGGTPQGPSGRHSSHQPAHANQQGPRLTRDAQQAARLAQQGQGGRPSTAATGQQPQSSRGAHQPHAAPVARRPMHPLSGGSHKRQPAVGGGVISRRPQGGRGGW